VVNPLTDQIFAFQNALKAFARPTPKRSPTVGTHAPEEDLDTFYRFLPAKFTLPETIGQLYAAAASQGIPTDQADYHLDNDRDLKLTRYNIVLPAKGSYVQIRKFVAQALNDIPSLSLDSIAFSRQKVEDTSIEAQLNFTLYLGEE
jgi:Tfp pilus assembly protein PilO